MADTGPAFDAGLDAGSPMPDAGGTSDRCSGDYAMAIALLGCNGGFVTTAPTPNHDYGTCTGSPDGTHSSCTDPDAVCVVSSATTIAGFCRSWCPVATTEISTGTYPIGSRCFAVGGMHAGAVCRRDCDATHRCPTGFTCDAQGGCSWAPRLTGRSRSRSAAVLSLA